MDYKSRRQSQKPGTATFHPPMSRCRCKGERQTHYVMIELAVQTHYPERIKQIDSYMPLVHYAVLKCSVRKSMKSYKISNLSISAASKTNPDRSLC